MSKDELVEVTQADRQAAVDAISDWQTIPFSFKDELAERFAAHRIASERAVLEAAAKVADTKAKQWRDFAAMALPAMPLPAMPDPAVCRIHAEKAEEIAAAIRSLSKAQEGG